jgi:hypothetical protein
VARLAAIADAQEQVAREHPQFATVKPEVYGYLVRMRRIDGPVVDVWVDPDVGDGRFFEGVPLEKWPRE